MPKKAAETLHEVLDMLLDLALSAIAKVARARITAQPALDVVQRDARELLGDGRVLLAELRADLVFNLGADAARRVLRAARDVLHSAAKYA